MTFAKLPRLGKFGGKKWTAPGASTIRRPRGVRYRMSRSLNYQRIKEDVEREIARLPEDKQMQIPAGTLPERMVALAMVQLGWIFAAQVSEDGGRLRLGGGVIDFKVFIGSKEVIVRVQGDYWHSLPARKMKDIVQWTKLHALGYRVADLWEKDIYTAWVENRLKQYVAEAIQNAA